MRKLLVLALAVLSTSCAYEVTVRARTFHAPYQDAKGSDTLALTQGLIAAGVPDVAILEALRSRGLNDVEAKQMLLVAGIAMKAK